MATPLLITLAPTSGLTGSSVTLTGSDFTNYFDSNDPTLSNDPTSYFRLDGTYQDQENNYTLTQKGSASFASGNIYKFLDLDGSSDYLQTNLTWESLRGTSGSGSFSFSCWIFVDVFGSNRILWQGGGDGTDAQDGAALWLNTSAKLVYSNNNDVDVVASSAITVNLWTHVCGVINHDGTATSNIYVDGVLDTNLTNFTSATWGTNQLDSYFNWFARIDGTTSASEFFDGGVDEIYWWNNVAITQTDATNLYAQTRGTPSFNFKLNDNYTDTEGNFTMSAVGSPSFVTGQFGNAVDLNGSSQYLTTNMPSNAVLGYVTPIAKGSVNFWFNLDALKNHNYLFMSGNEATNKNISAYVNSSGAILLEIGASTSSATTNVTISTSTWYNFTGIWYYSSSLNKNVFDAYINNTKLDSSFNATVANLSVSSYNLIFGARDSGGSFSNYLNGKIDEVFYWNDHNITTGDIALLVTGVSDPVVKFGTNTATVTTLSNQSIVATVPNINSGVYSMTVTNADGASNGIDFTITSLSGSDPQMMIRWSNDRGYNWSNEHWRSMGKIGKMLTRVILRRLGISRNRVYEYRISDPVKIAIIGGSIEVTPLKD